jgi:hypothetical protein
MLVTADQLVAHLVGDYVLQSDWMANEKTKRNTAAMAHALVYSLAFLLLHPSLAAWLVIVATHFAIDRWRLARYVVWAKNLLAPRRTATAWEQRSVLINNGMEKMVWRVPTAWQQNWHPWSDCSGTGYPSARPPWLAVWLLIIADNTLHVLINAAALRWLP